MAEKDYVGKNALAHFWLILKGKLGEKVDKVDGKGLSTNDFTTEEKTKLAGIDAEANKYVLPTASANTLGGVKVGTGLQINASTGELSTTGGGTADNVDWSGVKNKPTTISGYGITDASIANRTITLGDKTVTVPTESANENVIEVIKVNNNALTPDSNKTVNIDISGKEDSSNKTKTISSTSTDTQYPTAKAVYTELGKKVTAVSGKGLSTNDYTTTDKNKLAGIAEGAQVNIIEKISLNGNELTITDKTAAIAETDPVFSASVAAGIKATDISNWNGKQNTITFNTTYNASTNKAATMKDIPTDNKNLTNGAGYQTSSQVQSAINTALEGITGIDFQVVTNLPTTGTKGVIYLKSNGGTAPNIYDEYIWLSSSSKYEKIGTTEVDLSGYQLSSELVEISNDDIDTIVANN